MKSVISVARSIITHQLANIMILREVTRRTVRLYLPEGDYLSRKDFSRLTWYTRPSSAVLVHLGRVTGRMVYVDLELDCLSDYSYTPYGLGDGAYTLKGNLIQLSKNRRKYATEEIMEESEREIAAQKLTALKEVI